MVDNTSKLAWLGKLLFLLLLGPVMLFPDRFPNWAVFLALGLLFVPGIVRILESINSIQYLFFCGATKNNKGCA